METKRKLTGHQVNVANDKLEIEVLDEQGPGGAHHIYEIRGFDSRTNPSCPSRRTEASLSRSTTLLFQNGPIGECGVNGTTHEALLAVLIDRMECFQAGPYACQENQDALEHLRGAQAALAARTNRRVAAGTEGTHALDAPVGTCSGPIAPAQ